MLQPYKEYMYSYPHKTAYRPLGNLPFGEYRPHIMARGGDIYLHIPFCESKCGYCNLFSITSKESGSLVDRYLDGMARHMEQASCYGAPWTGLVIGGGTPLLLSVKQLSRLFQMAATYLGADPRKVPASVETSPRQTSSEKVELLSALGVGRVSIGVQSLVDDELIHLGRRHDANSSRLALDLLAKAGFPCLNVDLIYGIPGQTQASLKYSLDGVTAYMPREIFLYPLYIRPGTGLYGRAAASADALEQYKFGRDYLLGRGYTQLSMRRFTKDAPSPGSCGFENSLAFGCGGRSYIGDIHFCWPYSTHPVQCRQLVEEYIIREDKTAILHGIRLNREEHKRRYIIKNLLSARGISLAEYASVFHGDLLSEFSFIHRLIKEGYIARSNGFLVLTPDGLAYSDAIGPMFISQEVRSRMEAYRDV